MIVPTLLEHVLDSGESFKVRLEQQHGFLRAYVHEGRDSLAVSIAMWKLLAEQCALHGARKLLVIEDLDATVDRDDVPKVIDAMADFGFASIRTAFVEMQDDLQGSEHGGILLTERGIAIHVSNDEFVARHWLMYGE
ncbi:hypothetical protein LVB87_13705 [Lysobacter sp. KIS68-7]|uniref:hypothetical protein n=1 Tax=Lysobacter sp. KIS68-7 TaxID=2904252 RepID=UPI001E3C9160|nr:hypothetical protein [Lysobacter sp. KIS68-7]UHQ19226.1 hypothetical protein LVB87_13705 [Lysobacter sp. KIS68-7]